MTYAHALIFFAVNFLAVAWIISRAKLDDCTCKLCVVRREGEER